MWGTSRRARGVARPSRGRLVRWLAFSSVAAGVALGPPLHVFAICRVVEPVEESGMPPVAFSQTTSALYVLAPSVVVDYRCPEIDAGPADDAGETLDAAIDEPDAGDVDAGESLDAGEFDLGDPIDAGVIAMDEDAGESGPPRCGDGTLAAEVLGPVVSLVVQPSILSRAGEAGLVMPVPARPDLALGPGQLFRTISAEAPTESPTIHETVIVIEDPSLGLQCTDPHYTTDATDVLLGAPAALYGCSSSGYYRPGTEWRDARVIDYGDGSTVLEEEIPVSDDYDAVSLSASEIGALTRWLDDHQFAHDAIDDAAFAAYVGPGRWFVALHVHPDAVGATGETVALQPLVVSWRGEEIPIPHRLQFDPDGGSLMTDAFVFAPERRDAADGSAVTISATAMLATPTLSGFGLDVGWLTHVHIGRNQADDIPDSALVASSAGAVAATPPMREQTVRVHIPSACCVGGTVGVTSASAQREFTHERTYADTGEPPPIPEDWLRTSHALSESVCANAGSAGCGSGGSGGGGSGGGGSSGSSRPLRGCSASAARVPTFIPVALAMVWLARRARRRR
jgi:hypothetical protein